MGVILGIDIGGSTTKIVGYTSEKKLISMLQVKSDDQLTSVYGAFGKFISTNNLSLSDIERIILTGVGASMVAGNIYDIPTETVDEFVAIGLGGLAMSGKEKGLIVSMGTGTAYVRAEGNDIVHIGGSGVGGGTLLNLCSRLTNASHFDTIVEMSADGNLENVDLTISDICNMDAIKMPAYTTASNFGKLVDGVSKADLTLGVMNMVFQTIGMMAVFACRNDSIKDVVLTGTLTTVPQAKKIFDQLSHLHNINFMIPENAIYSTATGAALSHMI